MERTLPSPSGPKKKVKLKSLNSLVDGDIIDYKKILSDKHKRETQSPPKRIS